MYRTPRYIHVQMADVAPVCTAKRPREEEDDASTLVKRQRREPCDAPSPPSASSELTATTADRLVLVKKIGQGQYGKVYVGKWDTDTCLRAVKVLLEPAQDFDLDVPPIIRELVFSGTATGGASRSVLHFSQAGMYGIVSPLAHCTLTSARRPPIAAVRILGRALLEDLARLHAQGVMHRDVKPENIVATWSAANGGWPSLRLIDFGLSVKRNRARDPHVVTLWWRAPEVLLALPYTNKLDVWAMGVILSDWCSNVPFATRGAEDEADACRRIWGALGLPSQDEWPQLRKSRRFARFRTAGDGATDAPLPPSEACVLESHRAAQGVISRMLQQNPDARPTVEEVLQDPFWTETSTPHDAYVAEQWVHRWSTAYNFEPAVVAQPCHVYFSGHHVVPLPTQPRRAAFQLSEDVVSQISQLGASRGWSQTMRQCIARVAETTLPTVYSDSQDAAVHARAALGGAVYVVGSLFTDDDQCVSDLGVALAAPVELIKSEVHRVLAELGYALPAVETYVGVAV